LFCGAVLRASVCACVRACVRARACSCVCVRVRVYRIRGHGGVLPPDSWDSARGIPESEGIPRKSAARSIKAVNLEIVK